jgi:hypothetical protein
MFYKLNYPKLPKKEDKYESQTCANKDFAHFNSGIVM